MGEVLLTVRPSAGLTLKYAMHVGEKCDVHVVGTHDWETAEKRLLIYFHEVPTVVLPGTTVLTPTTLRTPGSADTTTCVVFVDPDVTGSPGAGGLDLGAEKDVSGATIVLEGFYVNEHGGLAAEESAAGLAALREIVRDFYADAAASLGATEAKTTKLVFDGDVNVEDLDVTYVRGPNEGRTYVVMQVHPQVNSISDINFQNPRKYAALKAATAPEEVTVLLICGEPCTVAAGLERTVVAVKHEVPWFGLSDDA